MSNFQTEQEFSDFKKDLVKSIFFKAKEYLDTEQCMLLGSAIRVERNGCYIFLKEIKNKVTKDYIEVALNLQIELNQNLDLFDINFVSNFVVLNDWFRSNYQQNYQYAIPVYVKPGTIQTNIQIRRNSVAQRVASVINWVQVPSFRTLKKSHKKNKDYVFVINQDHKNSLITFVYSQEDNIQVELENGLNCLIDTKSCVVRWSLKNPGQVYLRFV